MKPGSKHKLPIYLVKGSSYVYMGDLNFPTVIHEFIIPWRKIGLLDYTHKASE